MKKHATALRPITHADDSFDTGDTILNMDRGQFADWCDAGMVREATEKEVAAAKGEKAPAARKAKVKARARKAVEPTAAATPAEATIAARDDALHADYMFQAKQAEARIARLEQVVVDTDAAIALPDVAPPAADPAPASDPATTD